MDCTFFGVVVAPGKKVPVVADFDEDECETIHITQAALGENAAPGSHTVFVESNGERFAIGTLDSKRCPQFSCDLTLGMDAVLLSHSGPSPVHLTGYSVHQMIAGNDSDEDDDDDDDGGHYASDEDEDDSDEVSDDDDEAPFGVPLGQANGIAKAKGGGKAAAVVGARQHLQDEEVSEDEDEDEDEDEEEDSDIDDVDEELIASSSAKRGRIPAFGFGDDDSSEEQLSSGEEDEDEDEEEEVKVEPPQKKHKQQHQQSQLRKAAPQHPAQTPQPVKQASVVQQRKAPATAPAKSSGAAAASQDREYLQALKAALLKTGPSKLAKLGSLVPRPAGVPKVKAFIDKHPQAFKYDKANDVVSLVA